MNGVAAKIAKKIGMFFQNDNVDTGASEQVAGHYPLSPPPAITQRVCSFSAMRFNRIRPKSK